MATPLVIGCPVWDRGWALPIYFDSIRANCLPDETGLVFVVPASDTHSREVIAECSKPFAWCEIIRDRSEQHDREARRDNQHLALAKARNLLLHHVVGVEPDWYLSWDSDLLVAPGTLGEVKLFDKPIATVWTWLNRRVPQQGQHFDEATGQFLPVQWDEPMNATAMRWDDKHPNVAVHHDPADWDTLSSGCWQADVVLAWQLMSKQVYSTTRYGSHPHGEDIPFNWALHRRGIERWCYGQSPGVHLFDRKQSEVEIEDGFPAIMAHAKDKPLASFLPPPESEALRRIGFYPREVMVDAASN